MYVYAVESVIGIIYLFIYAAGARRGCGEGGDGIVNRFACALFLGVMCRYGYVEVEMDIVSFRVYGYTCIYTYQQQQKGPMWELDRTDGRMS